MRTPLPVPRQPVIGRAARDRVHQIGCLLSLSSSTTGGAPDSPASRSRLRKARCSIARGLQHAAVQQEDAWAATARNRHRCRRNCARCLVTAASARIVQSDFLSAARRLRSGAAVGIARSGKNLRAGLAHFVARDLAAHRAADQPGAAAQDRDRVLGWRSTSASRASLAARHCCQSE